MIIQISRYIAEKYGYKTEEYNNMTKVINEIERHIRENYVSKKIYLQNRNKADRLENENKSLRKEVSDLRACFRQLRINADISWKVKAENGKQTTSKSDTNYERPQTIGLS